MKNPQKGFIVPLLLIIIAILIVGGGAYFYTQTKSENPLVTENVTLPQATSTAQVSDSQVADSKIYTNTQYGFSFEYPVTEVVNFAPHTIPHGTDLILPGDSNQKGGNGIEMDGSVGTILNFWIFRGPQKNLVQYISNTATQAGVTYTSEKINGADAYRVRFPQNSVSWVYIQDSKHLFIFTYQDGSASEAKQILSTFKFTQTTPTPETSIVFPPNGWYVHNFDTSIMLTKQKTLPNCQGTEGACYGEQIDIHSSSITLTPEQYIAKIIQDGVFPSAQKWDTLNEHKTFSMTYTTEANDVPTDGQYLFVGNTVYQFLLYPSAEKDRADFQQVVKYYATSNSIPDPVVGRLCGGGVAGGTANCPTGYICKYPANHSLGAIDGTCVKN